MTINKYPAAPEDLSSWYVSAEVNDKKIYDSGAMNLIKNNGSLGVLFSESGMYNVVPIQFLYAIGIEMIVTNES